jgi:hypothetical protein
MHIHADPSHNTSSSTIIEELAGPKTTETDSRSQRSRVSRWGGQVLTRPLGSRYKNGLPWLLPRECPEPDGQTLRQPRRHRGWDARDVIPVTNAIESLNARFRRAVRRRGHFPNDQAALKVLYLTIREKVPNRTNPVGQVNGWKSILNALTIHYGDRLATN